MPIWRMTLESTDQAWRYAWPRRGTGRRVLTPATPSAMTMATDASFMDYVREQAAFGAALTERKMFGDYAVYLYGKVVAFACRNQLFVKSTEPGRQLLGSSVKEGAPYPGAKPHLLMDAEIETPGLLHRLLMLTADALPPPKPRVARAAAVSKKMAATPSPASTSKALSQLPNLGPKSQAMLVAVGLHTLPQLQRQGAVAVYLKVKRSGQNASLNLLWALEGALSGQPWQEVARTERTRLLLALEDLERGQPR
jgi:TfoX/Sxy family transcriptional regulator of competence genes